MIRVALVGFLLAASAPAALAQTTERDLQVLGRAIDLMRDGGGAEASVAVVYDATNPDSQTEAEALSALAGGGMDAGPVRIQTYLVPVGDLAGLDSARVVFVTKGIDGAHAQVFNAAGSRLTVSSDIGCARAGHCVLAITTTPSVRIFLNSQAASQASISFSEAFAMLVEVL